MKITNFKKAKARKQSHQKKVKSGVLELQRQYQENVRFYEQWYDEHVIGQDEKGGWIYKET